MITDLTGKRALITGAAKRVGRTVALALAEAGVHVAITYRLSSEEAEATRRDIEALGVKAVKIAADLTTLSECDRLVEEVFQFLGNVDVLVNNASLFPRTPLEGLARNREQFQRHFDRLAWLHMRAPLYLGMKLGLEMKKSGWGRIINITDSVTARGQAYRNHGLYLATKYGLFGVSQVLAEELRPEVTVNSIAPGLVLPPSGYTAEQTERLVRRVPLKRPVGPEEVAADVLHLIRSEGKTGTVVVSDGGAGNQAGRMFEA